MSWSPFDDADWVPIIAEYTREMAEEFRPFDYGRFEFRFDKESGTVNFLEVNLQANLWSKKVFGQSADARRDQPGRADRDDPLRGAAPPRPARAGGGQGASMLVD